MAVMVRLQPSGVKRAANALFATAIGKCLKDKPRCRAKQFIDAFQVKLRLARPGFSK